MSSEYLRDLTDYVTALSSLSPLMKGIKGRTAMNYAKLQGNQKIYERLKQLGGVDLDENSKMEQNPSDDGAAARSDSNLRPQLPNGACPCFQDPEMQKLLSSSDYIPGFFSNASFMIMMYLSRFCTHRSNNQETGNTSTSSDGTDNISREQGGSPASDDNISQEQGGSPASVGDYNINQEQGGSPASDYNKNQEQGSSPANDYNKNQEQGSPSRTRTRPLLK